jgi:hypothetical protein
MAALISHSLAHQHPSRSASPGLEIAHQLAPSNVRSAIAAAVLAVDIRPRVEHGPVEAGFRQQAFNVRNSWVHL